MERIETTERCHRSKGTTSSDEYFLGVPTKLNQYFLYDRK
jgi:hypothetical protein